MMNRRTAVLAAAIAGLTLGEAPALEYPYQNVTTPPTPAQRRRWRAQRDYPISGTGKRQGERIARQVARAFGDPFKASNDCLARIAERLGRASDMARQEEGK